MQKEGNEGGARPLTEDEKARDSQIAAGPPPAHLFHRTAEEGESRRNFSLTKVE